MTMRRWLVLALASTITAEPEDDALAAYVRFARTTLPRLEKAWAAPHRADAAKQTGRGRVLLLTFPNSGTSYTIRAAECLADSQMCSSYLHECEKSRVVKESTSHPFLRRRAARLPAHVRRGYDQTHRHARRALPRPLGRLRRAGHQALHDVTTTRVY